MAEFYLRVVAENARKGRIAAVCFQAIENGRPSGNLSILVSDEWGEKEILRKVKSLGLFEPDDSFAPIGPRVREDLSLIVDRASHHGLLKWSPDSRGEFISKKSSRSGLQSLEETIGTSEDIRKSPKHESNRELIERMHREAESFFSARLRPPQC